MSSQPLAEEISGEIEAPELPLTSQDNSEAADQETAAPATEFRDARREQRPARPLTPKREVSRPPTRDFQPATPAAVSQAIEHVNQIIETLRGALSDMEDVLETLELAERQKTADEQEIETLRRGLRHLHRPRESGQSHPRH
ncbi:MAG TPA: hypothetical protein PLC99_09945 [Verrucomicrobiota bacterium]|nr:hypothetical protein [Verrucomicrobiota bacterium]